MVEPRTQVEHPEGNEGGRQEDPEPAPPEPGLQVVARQGRRWGFAQKAPDRTDDAFPHTPHRAALRKLGPLHAESTGAGPIASAPSGSLAPSGCLLYTS